MELERETIIEKQMEMLQSEHLMSKALWQASLLDTDELGCKQSSISASEMNVSATAIDTDNNAILIHHESMKSTAVMDELDCKQASLPASKMNVSAAAIVTYNTTSIHHESMKSNAEIDILHDEGLSASCHHMILD